MIIYKDGEIVVDKFLQTLRSVILATLDVESKPFTSYAPFVRTGEGFYVFISDIARHSENLKRDGSVALFFAEDESKCEQIFARKRVSLQGNARLIGRNEALFSDVMKRFESRFDANLVKMLQSMSDFNLFEIIPAGGEAVFGFGEAYEIEGADLSRLKPKRSGGHRRK